MSASRTGVRSLLASVGTGGLEIAVFAICAAVLPGRTLILARWLVGASGSTANYFVNRRWAFAARDAAKRQQGWRFAVATLAAITLATVLWTVIVELGLDPRVAHVASMGGVWLVFTYPVMKRWVFSARSAAYRPRAASRGAATSPRPPRRPRSAA